MPFSRDQFARPGSVGEKVRGAQDHLGDRVADYVDGMLDVEDQYRADLHLTVCEHCRYAVRQERAIIAQLRSVSFDCGGHEQLMAGLLSLASSEPGEPMGAAGSPKAAAAARPAPAVVTSSAPPQYQSARKSMACALFAVAGCVGVALVASTASGVAQGPDGSGQQAPGRGAALVREVSSPQVTHSTGSRESVNRSVPMFVQVAAHPTP